MGDARSRGSEDNLAVARAGSPLDKREGSMLRAVCGAYPDYFAYEQRICLYFSKFFLFFLHIITGSFHSYSFLLFQYRDGVILGI